MAKKISVLCFGVLGMVAIVGVLAWFGGTSDATFEGQNSVPSEVLNIPEKFFDFGSVSMKDGKVSRSFEFTNNSVVPVDIGSIATSCMCTEGYLKLGDIKEGPFGMAGMGRNKLWKTVNPGETGFLEVVFDPAAHGPAGIGVIAREVAVSTTQGKFSLQFSANVTP